LSSPSLWRRKFVSAHDDDDDALMDVLLLLLLLFLLLLAWLPDDGMPDGDRYHSVVECREVIEGPPPLSDWFRQVKPQ